MSLDRIRRHCAGVRSR